jgi:hypothetical protein
VSERAEIEPANASELLALSLSVLRRERCDLRCSPGGERIVLSLTAAVAP